MQPWRRSVLALADHCCAAQLSSLAAATQQLVPLLGPAGLASSSSLSGCQQHHPDLLMDARVNSSKYCSTSSSNAPGVVFQQLRGYAKAAKGAASKPAAKADGTPSAAGTVGGGGDSLSPPEFRVRRVPRVYKADPMNHLTSQQKALLESLNDSGTPLRSLRQLGWPLGPQEVLAMWHQQLGDATGSNVYVMPFVLDNMFQSAMALASVVKDYIMEGKGMAQVEQAMLTTIANTPPEDIPFEGLKILLKGRMSGKGGKASKKVWEWGRTSASNLADPLDYAHEAVVTRAGYIGIKVWIKYKRSHMSDQAQRSSRSDVSVAEVLSMPPPVSLPSRSSSAWWNVPSSLQPQQHQAWKCYKPGYDALTGSWQPKHQNQLVANTAAPAALEPSS